MHLERYNAASFPHQDRETQNKWHRSLSEIKDPESFDKATVVSPEHFLKILGGINGR